QGLVGAHGHDEGGALLVGEQHGDVLAGAGGGEDHVLHTEIFDPVQSGGGAVPVGVHHDLGAGGQSLVRDGVHVPDDQVRAQPFVQDGVRPAVHTDQQRPVLPDEGSQDRQVVFVAVAADHDEHLAALE